MRTFTEQEINLIHKIFIHKDPSYFKKYEELPPCPVRSWNYSWSGKDFPRNWAILDFIEWIQKYSIISDTIAYTYDDPELEFLPHKNKVFLPYPPYDLHTFGSEFTNSFDFFLFNQTLEHLYNPYAAVEQIFSTLKPGGFVFTSVPTLNIPHHVPFHFTGFTPMGLAVLFMSAGFEVLEIGQWGNYEYISKLWNTHSWPSFEDLQHENRVTNEDRNVCQCWILARKPAKELTTFIL